LIDAKAQGKVIAALAGVWGNTAELLWISTDFIDYTVDLSPYKQGLYLNHIPSNIQIRYGNEAGLPLILPWNLKEKIMAQMAYSRMGCLGAN